MPGPALAVVLVKIAVLSPTHDRYLNWCKEVGFPPSQVVHLDGPEDVFGFSIHADWEPTVVAVAGGWRETGIVHDAPELLRKLLRSDHLHLYLGPPADSGTPDFVRTALLNRKLAEIEKTPILNRNGLLGLWEERAGYAGGYAAGGKLPSGLAKTSLGNIGIEGYDGESLHPTNAIAGHLYGANLVAEYAMLPYRVLTEALEEMPKGDPFQTQIPGSLLHHARNRRGRRRQIRKIFEQLAAMVAGASISRSTTRQARPRREAPEEAGWRLPAWLEETDEEGDDAP